MTKPRAQKLAWLPIVRSSTPVKGTSYMATPAPNTDITNEQLLLLHKEALEDDDITLQAACEVAVKGYVSEQVATRIPDVAVRYENKGIQWARWYCNELSKLPRL